MDGHTIEQVRELLLRRRSEIDRSGGREPIQITDQEEMVPHAAESVDMAQNLEQLDRDTSLAEQERRELTAIQHALAKLSSGNFGSCEDCSEPISSKRLLVLPEARLCANCQALEERSRARTATR